MYTLTLFRRQITPDAIKILDAPPAPAGRFRTIQFKAFGLEIQGHLANALLTMESVVKGRHENCGDVPIDVNAQDADDEALRRYIARAFDEAIGAAACARLTPTVAALRLVADAKGMSGRLVLTGGESLRKPMGPNLRVAKPEFRPFRFISCLRRRHFQRLDLLEVEAMPLSAHERLDIFDSVPAAFEAYGIDIRAWWGALGIPA